LSTSVSRNCRRKRPGLPVGKKTECRIGGQSVTDPERSRRRGGGDRGWKGEEARCGVVWEKAKVRERIGGIFNGD